MPKRRAVRALTVACQSYTPLLAPSPLPPLPCLTDLLDCLAVQILLEGSTFDTTLSVFTGVSYRAPLVLIGQNDDVRAWDCRNGVAVVVPGLPPIPISIPAPPPLTLAGTVCACVRRRQCFEDDLPGGLHSCVIFDGVPNVVYRIQVSGACTDALTPPACGLLGVWGGPGGGPGGGGRGGGRRCGW